MDWAEFTIHLIIGLLVGAAAGALVWFFTLSEFNPVHVIGGIALAVGLLSAFFGERFWKFIGENGVLNPFNWW